MSALRRMALPLALMVSGCDWVEGDGGTNGTSGAWTLRAHPCVENRTDALWLDDASVAFVGCGSGVNGRGLYQTTDAGLTWDLVSATGDVFADMRVNSISRGPDGLLYVAGTADGGVRVVTLEGSQADIFYAAPSERPQVWQTFQVGTFRMDDAGRAVSESLTGSDVIYWPTDVSDGVNGEGWWNQAGIDGGAQILDLDVYDGRFYGSGSTINQPPYFYYESTGGMGTTFAFEAIKLSGEGLEDFTGEAWDVDVDASGNGFVAGVRQDTNTGVLWFSTGDLTVASNWEMYDISPLVSGDSTSTRFYGGCRSGETMVAVGDFSNGGDALVVVSTDGGATWGMANPPGTGVDAVGTVSRCSILGTDVYVAGADGLFGILDTAEL